MKQNNRDKYFSQLGTNVIIPVEEPHRTSLEPFATQKQILARNTNKGVVNPLVTNKRHSLGH